MKTSISLILLVVLRTTLAIAQTDSSAPTTEIQAQQTEAPQSPQADQSTGQQPPPQTVLPVKPGPEVIKDKDLYEATGYWHPFTRMPRYILSDQKAIWTSPFHARPEDIKLWVIFGGITAATVATDRFTERRIPNSNSTAVRVGTDASRFGQTYTLLPIGAAFYLAGTATHSEHFRETGLISFEALADTGILQLAVKSATNRARPTESDHQGHFWDSGGSPVKSGFPSGHSIATFAMASVVAHEYHNIWVRIAVYGYAGGVMAARVAAGQHFPGDVVAGGVMGWFVGDYVYGKRHNPELDHKSITHKVLDHVNVRLGI